MVYVDIQFEGVSQGGAIDAEFIKCGIVPSSEWRDRNCVDDYVVPWGPRGA